MSVCRQRQSQIQKESWRQTKHCTSEQNRTSRGECPFCVCFIKSATAPDSVCILTFSLFLWTALGLPLSHTLCVPVNHAVIHAPFHSVFFSIFFYRSVTVVGQRGRKGEKKILTIFI